MKYFKLNNGIDMPQIGIGCNTFGKVDHDYYAPLNYDTTELKTAIEAGYRHLDTAISYRNEAVIGKAVKESGIARSEFFLTSKLPGEPEFMKDEATIRENVLKSVENLGAYIDLYLIHHPWDDNADMLRVWSVLETFVDSGHIKSLGVSNFNEEQLTYIMEHSRIKPTTNQIKIQAGNWNRDLVDVCLKMNVVPVAWSPLNRLSDDTKAKIGAIGKPYHKTWAQVILNYLTGLGIAVIPKSHNATRQKENLDIYDFNLSPEDKEILEKI